MIASEGSLRQRLRGRHHPEKRPRLATDELCVRNGGLNRGLGFSPVIWKRRLIANGRRDSTVNRFPTFDYLRGLPTLGSGGNSRITIMLMLVFAQEPSRFRPSDE